MPIGENHPKVGDVVGDRTIIRVDPTFIIFGQREGDLANCGAYFTDYREWFRYEAEQERIEQERMLNGKDTADAR